MEHLGLRAVEIEAELRRLGVVAGERGENPGTGVEFRQEHLLERIKPDGVRPRFVLNMHRDAVCVAQTGNRRRSENLPLRLGDRLKHHLDLRNHLRDVLLRRRTLVPAFKIHDERSLVLTAAAHHAPAGDGEDGLDFRNRPEQLDRPQRRLAAAVARRALRHFHRAEDHALVLVRKKRRFRLGEHMHGHQNDQQKQHQREEDAACEPLRHRDEEVLERIERLIEPRERPALIGARLPQEERAERRRERKRAHGGEAHRCRERHRELLVDAPGDAAHEADGHEDAQENESRRDDRARHVLHCLDGRLPAVELPGFDEELDALDYDDAVVDHDADGEHQAEEREDVDRIPEQRHQDEGRAERHGDRETRNQRRAPVLQEEVADEDDEAERQKERKDDFLNAHAHVLRRVVGRGPLQIVGEVFLQLAERVVDRVHRFNGVRARLLLQGDHDGVLAVELTGEHIVLFADFGPRDILELDDAALVVAADDDLVELGGFHETALGGQGIDMGSVSRNGGRAHLTDRRLHVLLGDGGYHLLGVEPLRGHAVGIEPDAHGETRPVDRRVAHAGDSQKNRLDVAVDVVGNLQARHLAGAGFKRHEAEHVFGLRADSAAELLHFRRQFRLGLRNAVLHLDHVHVAVGFDLE